MLGNIIERDNTAPKPPSAPRAPSSSSAGFPVILHRSQKPKRPSAFAAASARQARDTGVGRAVEHDDIPVVTSSIQGARPDTQAEAGPSTPRAVKEKENENTQIQREIGDENVRKVAEMSIEEREEEVRELEERFGAGVLAALKKRAEKWAAGMKDGASRVLHSSGQPTSTATAAVGSPSQVQHAAPARTRSVKFTSSPPINSELKSTYFANTAAEPDKLAWMTSSSSESTASSIRFDLSGHQLSSSQQSDLPTYLGLHHHGDQPDLAGYTIGEILLLCRSTVPAQRMSMMGLLSKVIALHVLPSAGEGEEVRRICADGKVCEKAVSLCVDVLHTTRNVTLLQVAIELLYTALGGPLWAGLTNAAFCPGPDADGRAAPISSVPFEELLHRLSELLTTPDYLPSISIHHLILILRRASTIDRETAETILPLLPPLIQSHVTRRPWPAQTGKLPLVEPLRLAADLIASSRMCASEIVDAGLPSSLMRFCVVSTWSEEPLSVELCIEVLHLFGSLSRYGLSAGTARTAHEIWVVLGRYISSHCSKADTRIPGLAEAYLGMLEGWTTCAIDPHRTTPEHDLTWTQIAGLGWAEEAMRMIEEVLTQSSAQGTMGVLSAAMRLLGACTTGLGINGVKGGEEEKAEMRMRLAKSGLKKVLQEHGRRGTETDSQFILDALRLQAQLSTDSPIDDMGDFNLLGAEDKALLAGRELEDIGRLIQYELLRHTFGAMSDSANLRRSFELLIALRPGEEPLALDLLDDILNFDWTTPFPSLAPSIAGIGHKDSVTLLRPLLQHAILPNVTDITTPFQIHHLYLKATGTLRSPPPRQPDETGRMPPGLPLSREWFFHPIDELLHSADSAAFQQSPVDWTPTELEIVRATLVFLQLAVAAGYQLDSSALIFGLMKVYMLEHQTSGMVDTGESEIFRDEVVKGCLASLMDGLTLRSSTATSDNSSSARSDRTTKAGLEIASTQFLGLEPFYQFYTDLVSLFENTSFGDATFARILLPPLAMTYPADYRKIFWSNQNVIRLIRTPLTDLPLENSEEGLKVFFEPVENDPEVLSAYGQAVVRGWVKPVQELLWKLAIYHLKAFFGQKEEMEVEGNQISAGEKERRIALDRLRKGLRGAVLESGNELVITALAAEDVQPWI